MKRLLAILFVPVLATAQYKVDINPVKFPVPPTLWGLFFEDINRSGDGGVYGDMIKNRSFDFPDAFMGWTTEPARNQYQRNDIFQVINESEKNPDNPKYLQVTITRAERILLINEGFRGLAVKKDGTYELVLRLREHQPGISLQADIIDGANKSIGRAQITLPPGNTGWQTIKATVTATETVSNAKLLIRFNATGKIDIDRISLFPKETWMDRPEGMRKDLVQLLADIQPGFMRFPGGCIVEGDNLATRYQWKKTIGPLEERKLNSNQWSSGGASGRAMPDYFQSYGLGFLEYFQLCEDMKAEPMPIINAGLSCQFGAGEVATAVDEYVQDALDLIEFANGDANTTWGKKRIDLGHPQPFHLKLIGIGNENWGPQYVERLLAFTQSIKNKYPYMQLITSTGYSPNPQFRYMDSVLRKLKVDIIDEHYYQTANWFLMNAGKYDTYDRNGPKIFLGEYACHSVRIGSTENKNTLFCALAEAAFMTGVERNADIVSMAAYAPLFAHVNDWQWTPNLIWFDNRSSYATPSYYVQQLFSRNKGTDVVAITDNGETIKGQDSLWASAVTDRNTKELIIKLVNPSSGAKQKTIGLPGLKTKNSTWVITLLKSDQPGDMNSIGSPELVKPATENIEVKNRKITIAMTPYSFAVIRVKL